MTRILPCLSPRPSSIVWGITKRIETEVAYFNPAKTPWNLGRRLQEDGHSAGIHLSACGYLEIRREPLQRFAICE